MIAVIFRDNLPSFIFCVMLLISAGLNQALAAVDPKPLPADTRMGELIYDADQIFRIHSALGIATHIILAPGEKIVSSAAGQPADCRLKESDWCIVALVGTDELYIQPRLAGPARNNLQLTTNLRRYSFEFIHAPRAGEAAPFWFRVTFRYPGQRLAATATPISKSPQLASLLGYALDFESKNCNPNSTSLQFMGEFLHAFQDTYAHRDPGNKPFGTNAGIGHGIYISHPDYTYNHKSIRPHLDLNFPYVHIQDDWVNNESRTLHMELAVYNQIVDYLKARNYDNFPEQGGKVTPIMDAMQALLDFNSCQVDEDSAKDEKTCAGEDAASEGEKVGMDAKIDILNQALITLGYDERIVWSPGKNAGIDGYNIDNANDNRSDLFEKLKLEDYPAANLPKERK